MIVEHRRRPGPRCCDVAAGGEDGGRHGTAARRQDSRLYPGETPSGSSPSPFHRVPTRQLHGTPLSPPTLSTPSPASLCPCPPLVHRSAHLPSPAHLPRQPTRAGPAQYQNGPQATAMLCDYGAEVIKIERAAGGDPGRSLVSADGVRQPPAAAAPQPRSPQVSHAARCPAPPAVPVLQPGVQPRQALARSRHPPPGVARHSRETGAVG